MNRNQSLAVQVGFDTGLLREENFQKRWRVFQDSESGKFLKLFLEKRITELQALMENEKTLEGLQKLQGQILEVRKLIGFLSQQSISNEVQSLILWLK